MQGDAGEGIPVETRLSSRQPADQVPGQSRRFEVQQEAAHFVHQRPADGVLGGDLFDDHLASFGTGLQGLGQQVLHVEDFGATLAHDPGELVVLPLGALHPQHVVEEQFVVVGRGETLQAQLGAMDDHFAQFADFRIHAEGVHDGLLFQLIVKLFIP